MRQNPETSHHLWGMDASTLFSVQFSFFLNNIYPRVLGIQSCSSRQVVIGSVLLQGRVTVQAKATARRCVEAFQ